MSRKTTRTSAVGHKSLVFKQSIEFEKDLNIASERARERMEEEKREQEIAVSRSRHLRVIVK